MIYMISSRNPRTNKNFIKSVHCVDDPEVAKNMDILLMMKLRKRRMNQRHGQ